LRGKAGAGNGALAESKAVSSHRTKKLSPLDSLLATRWSFGCGEDAPIGIQSCVKAMASEKRRCLGAAVFEGKGGVGNGALAESKAVSSHRTKNLSPLDSLLATRHPLELWLRGGRAD
jgi:hypothetical protein